MKVRKFYFHTKVFMMQTQNSVFQMSEWMGNEFGKHIAFIFYYYRSIWIIFILNQSYTLPHSLLLL